MPDEFIEMCVDKRESNAHFHKPHPTLQKALKVCVQRIEGITS